MTYGQPRPIPPGARITLSDNQMPGPLPAPMSEADLIAAAVAIVDDYAWHTFGVNLDNLGTS